MKKTVSFEDTEIAFSGKSDRDLVRAYWLFRLIGYPPLMKVGKGLTKVGLALHLPIRGVVKGTIFKQFCGGETIQDSGNTAMYLKKYNIGTILDYSVEGQEDEEELDEVMAEIVATAETAGRNTHIPFCVFKPSGISPNDILRKVSAGDALDSEDQARFERVKERFDRICTAAREAGTPVFIDAEESWIQPAIDDLATEMMRRHNKEKAVVYNTIQLYRKDRLEFLERSYRNAAEGGYFLGEKLVRGAYMEKERE